MVRGVVAIVRHIRRVEADPAIRRRAQNGERVSRVADDLAVLKQDLAQCHILHGDAAADEAIAQACVAHGSVAQVPRPAAKVQPLPTAGITVGR